MSVVGKYTYRPEKTHDIHETKKKLTNGRLKNGIPVQNGIDTKHENRRLNNIIESEDDPWALNVTEEDDEPGWGEVSCGQKTKIVMIVVIKMLLLISVLYLFICSLGFLGDAFKLLGGKAAGKVFRKNELLQNPVAGLMIGVLATVLLQSSSTTTSIVITMTGANIIDIQQSIPMVMGANIGTSVTNTIVSLAQSADRGEFRRAFGGATVHDMFNWLSVLVLLPIEVACHYLFHLTKVIIDSMDLKQRENKQAFLKTITKPFTDLIVKVNKNVIKEMAIGKNVEHVSVLKRWCKAETILQNVTVHMSETFSQNGTYTNVIRNLKMHGVNVAVNTKDNITTVSWSEVQQQNVTVNTARCKNLFALSDFSDHVAGMLLLVLSLLLIITALISIVKILNSMLKGTMAKLIKRTINAEFPGVFAYFTGYVAILVGAGITMLIQSSSVFTSALTPLVGVGMVSIERMYPMTIGSNIGTTLTGIMAALAAPASEIPHTLQVALCHLFFNLSGLLLFYPFPFTRKAPIGLAKMLGNTTAKYRWFSILYLIMMFFLLPTFVFALSLAGSYVLTGVGIPVLVLLIIVVLINILQKKKTKLLPKKLQTWEFLPMCFHSLKPIDNIVSKVCLPCQRCCCKEEITRATHNSQCNKAFEGDEQV